MVEAARDRREKQASFFLLKLALKYPQKQRSRWLRWGRANLRKKAIKRMADPEARALLSQKAREQWASPEGRARKQAGMERRKQTKLKKGK